MKLDSGGGLAAAALPLRLALLGGILFPHSFFFFSSSSAHRMRCNPSGVPVSWNAWTLEWEKNGSECRSSKIPMAPETLELAVGGGGGGLCSFEEVQGGQDEAIRTDKIQKQGQPPGRSPGLVGGWWFGESSAECRYGARGATVVVLRRRCGYLTLPSL